LIKEIMKRAGLIWMLCIFLVIAGKAQPGQGRPGPGQPGQFNPEETAKRQTREIGEAVGFKEGQEAQVYDLNLKFAKKRQELRGGVSFRELDDQSRQAMREKMNALDTAKDKEMKKILTEDQFGKYEVYRQERLQRMRERPGQRPPR
jgi:hypothetical protein